MGKQSSVYAGRDLTDSHACTRRWSVLVPSKVIVKPARHSQPRTARAAQNIVQGKFHQYALDCQRKAIVFVRECDVTIPLFVVWVLVDIRLVEDAQASNTIRPLLNAKNSPKCLESPGDSALALWVGNR